MIHKNNKGDLEAKTSTEIIEMPKTDRLYPLKKADEHSTIYNPVSNRHKQLWPESSKSDYLG